MNPRARTCAAAYLAALVCFLALDAAWIGTMTPRLYRPNLAPLLAREVDWLAAVLFYAIYIGGLVYFAVAPALASGSPAVALRRGALLGLLAYATYDLTNQATLRDWPWAVTLADLAWGMFVSGAASWAAARITCRPGPRRTSR